MIVELRYDENVNTIGTGLDESTLDLLGRANAVGQTPIFPARTSRSPKPLFLTISSALYGTMLSKVFSDRLQEEIARRRNTKGSIDQRTVTYFQSDDE
ncbi:MAG: hypothetical protein IPH85_12445 [Ignavibacteria bacterium]|nr:hypothetical protein [Ignavibacteria bacterium]